MKKRAGNADQRWKKRNWWADDAVLPSVRTSLGKKSQVGEKTGAYIGYEFWVNIGQPSGTFGRCNIGTGDGHGRRLDTVTGAWWIPVKVTKEIKYCVERWSGLLSPEWTTPAQLSMKVVNFLFSFHKFDKGGEGWNKKIKSNKWIKKHEINTWVELDWRNE